MSVIQGIILGIIQGIAEFLPISSSGHLAVIQHLFGLEDVPLLFDVMLHLATLLAVVLYFRKKIWKLLKIFGRWISGRSEPKTSEPKAAGVSIKSSSGELSNENSADEGMDLLCGTDELGRKTIIAVVLSTLVTAVIGIWTSKIIDDSVISIKMVCVGFIVTAVLLFVSSCIERRNLQKNKNQATTSKGISVVQALFIGLMQGIGTLPGISRSGSTIAGAQFTKMNRAASGEYSFIISIPAILGAFVLELKKFLENSGQAAGSAGSIEIAPLIAGCAAAFAWGYIALAFLMKIIRRGRLEWFACYLIPLGVLGIVFF